MVKELLEDKNQIRSASDCQRLGWQHELWDVVRYFRSIGKNEKRLREFWLNHLLEKSSFPKTRTLLSMSGMRRENLYCKVMYANISKKRRAMG